jgi:hypothetical protein
LSLLLVSFCRHGSPLPGWCQSCDRERGFRSLVAGWWSAKQRRGYRRALSGSSIAVRVGDDLRFLTVTSSPVSPRVVQKSLQILVKRIRRKFGKFEYCGVRTSEGHGVIHLLYRGCFLPVAWIRHAWYEIHRAFEVWITVVDDRKGGIGGISRYMVTQYMSNQSLYVRGSSSRRWIFYGAVRAFRQLLRLSGYVGGLGDWKGVLVFQSIFELSAIG